MTSVREDLANVLNMEYVRLILYPQDVRLELEVNQWVVSRSPEDGPHLVPEVEEILIQVAETWTSFWADTKWATRRGYQATFYAWYDEQAGELRMCLTSRPPNKLPFGANVALLDHPRSIVQRFLADPAPGEITATDLIILTADSEAELRAFDEARQRSYILPVWTLTRSW